MVKRDAFMLGLVIGGMALCGWLAFATDEGTAPLVYRIADLKSLVVYPEAALPCDGPQDEALYVVVLPDSNLAVVLRPITESEYGSFQIQAIGYEIIELQMLAAAIVIPQVSESNVAGFPPELVEFLKRQVNAISGFDVFDVPPPPP